MDENVKLVDYSDSESEEEEQATPVQILDKRGRKVAFVEPTQHGNAPSGSEIVGDQNDVHNQEEETEESNSIQPDPVEYEEPEMINLTAESDIENPRHEEIIIISDSSQSTIILSPPRETDDHHSATSGNII